MISEKDIAFPRLTDAQIASLEPRGRRRAVRAGEVLFAEGDRGFSCYVVISGAIEIFESSRGDPHVVVVHGPQQFTGDVDMLTGRVGHRDRASRRGRGSARAQRDGAPPGRRRVARAR